MYATICGMNPITFWMQFRGHTSPLSPGVLTARASAPSGALVTRIDGDGVHCIGSTDDHGARSMR